MTDRLRWGILGTGNIARQFSAGVRASARGVLAAVGSRDVGKAQAFAEAHGIPAVAESYDALLSRDDVDAIYVSLPNSLHHQWTIAALAAGKHVLCEKPFAVSAAQAEQMFAAADRAGRVVMEAFMYRCHPQTIAVQRAVAAGAIGTPRLVRTSFCYRTTKVAGNVRFDPSLAGGALMDVGCYCLSFARLFLGEPVAGHATGNLHPTGVDDLVSGTLRYAGGAVAHFGAGTGVQADNSAYVCGDEGYIQVPVPWKPPAGGGEYVVGRSAPPKQDFAAGKAPPPPPREVVTVDAAGDVYGLEADDFAASVLDGKPMTVTREETLSVATWLERFRKEIGLGY
ncbi:MAG TPA: Gfo/Idh/MocA family oxidoreductase [Humisphaera sp.]